MSREKIAKQIKLLRNHLGLSQKEFAEKLDHKWYQIKDIETGRTKASIDILIKISEKFSVNANWLLTGEGPMFKEEAGEIGNETEKPDPLEKALQMMKMLNNEDREDVLKYIKRVKQMREMEKKITKLEKLIKEKPKE